LIRLACCCGGKTARAPRQARATAFAGA
jgi:hypothetical protein